MVRTHAISGEFRSTACHRCLRLRPSRDDKEIAVASYRTMYSLPKPSSLDAQSLRNWFYNNKPLIEEETHFVNHAGDLFAMAPRHDIGGLDRIIGRVINVLTPDIIARKVSKSLVSLPHRHCSVDP
jgi:hypothetical protein